MCREVWHLIRVLHLMQSQGIVVILIALGLSILMQHVQHINEQKNKFTINANMNNMFKPINKFKQPVSL